MRLSVGGDRINYPGDCGTPTADLLTVKKILNSVVPAVGAEFMKLGIKNFYICTPLKRYKYLRMKLSYFSEEIIKLDKLQEKVTADGYVYVEVRRGIYGLPQSGLLAQHLLEKRLWDHGYSQSKFTPGFWAHESRPLSFSLVVDYFSVKYVGKEHANHLIVVLKEHYELSEDWGGTKYC